MLFLLYWSISYAPSISGTSDGLREESSSGIGLTGSPGDHLKMKVSFILGMPLDETSYETLSITSLEIGKMVHPYIVIFLPL